MKFIAPSNGIEYRIRFKRDTVDWYFYKYGMRKVPCTVAIVLQGEIKIEEGLAVLSPSDQNVKETGRKIALTNALRNMLFTKEDRRAAWEAYFNRGNIVTVNESYKEPNEAIFAGDAQ